MSLESRIMVWEGNRTWVHMVKSRMGTKSVILHSLSCELLLGYLEYGQRVLNVLKNNGLELFWLWWSLCAFTRTSTVLRRKRINWTVPSLRVMWSLLLFSVCLFNRCPCLSGYWIRLLFRRLWYIGLTCPYYTIRVISNDIFYFETKECFLCCALLWSWLLLPRVESVGCSLCVECTSLEGDCGGGIGIILYVFLTSSKIYSAVQCELEGCSHLLWSAVQYLWWMSKLWKAVIHHSLSVAMASPTHL